MTPQERQLVTELFDRLASLEREARDPDAERAIAEGFKKAPNATYALVQSVLVQDEALKRANARIEELQSAASGEPPREGGFLDSMRNSLFGRDEPRGSVPSVRPGGMGTSGVWGAPRPASQDTGPWNSGAQPMQQAAPAFGGGGSSFLGTAAASAAGVIGGALLMNGIRSMFGGGYGGSHAAFDPGLSGVDRAPWSGDASGSDLARQAGLDDIGTSRTASLEGDRHAGLFGNDDQETSDDSFDDGGGFDGGDSDLA